MNAGMVEVTLRDVEEPDIAIFFEHQADPAHPPFTGIHPRTRTEYFAHWEKIKVDDTVMVKTIVVDGQTAGQVLTFNRIGIREVGYWLGQEFWGRGIATQALSMFLPLIEERPLYARTAKKNTASVRVLEKCGFRVVSEAEGFFDMEGNPIEGLHLRLDA